ncbi:MAG: AI-2E family transporter [Candidatus Woesearchaeota archaeon]
MKKGEKNNVIFIIVLLLFLVLTFLLIKPLITYIVMSFILVFAFYPLYRKLESKIKKPSLASAITVFVIILLIIIPIFIISYKIIAETKNAYSLINIETINIVSKKINNAFDTNIDLAFEIGKIFNLLEGIIISSSFKLVTSIIDVGIGLFVMFFIMFYLFKDWNLFISEITNIIPLKEEYKFQLLNKVKEILNGVIYGQVLIALTQGVLGGILLYVFRVPNALLWGVVMTIFAFIPWLGTPFVFVPAGIIKIIEGHSVSGIMIILLGTLVIMNIDNYLWPKVLSGTSKIHPVAALLGVIGGLKLFGFVGIIIGPIVIALLLALLKFYSQDIRIRDRKEVHY